MQKHISSSRSDLLTCALVVRATTYTMPVVTQRSHRSKLRVRIPASKTPRICANQYLPADAHKASAKLQSELPGQGKDRGKEAEKRGEAFVQQAGNKADQAVSKTDSDNGTATLTTNRLPMPGRSSSRARRRQTSLRTTLAPRPTRPLKSSISQ